MQGNVNCIHNDNGAWCKYSEVKRSFFGLGSRLCIVYPVIHGVCEFQEKISRPEKPPSPMEPPIDIIATATMLRKSFNDGDNVLAAVHKHKEDLRSLAIDLVDVIERVEFVSRLYHSKISSKLCPWCYADKSEGHRVECKREMVLAKAKILLGAGIK